jgi:hypothetical protein
MTVTRDGITNTILASPQDLLQGITFKASRAPSITIVPDSCGSRLFTVVDQHPSNGVAPQFDSGEHYFIGNAVQLFDSYGHRRNAATYNLGLANGLSLTYGSIVALAGDYYGLPNRPISTDASPSDAFRAAYATLAADPNAVSEVPRILAEVLQEVADVAAAIASGQEGSSAYIAAGEKYDDAYISITNGRMAELAAFNWDHFGPYAVTCYTLGHTLALEQAVAAKALVDPAAREAALQNAYALDAFANHFLTDLFSAGHMRTPRYEISTRRISGSSAVWDLLADSYLPRFMHDEDCLNGLHVVDARGNNWMAYGDARLRDTPDADNLARVSGAVSASVGEVYEAYLTGVVQTLPFEALQRIPDLAAVRDRSGSLNYSPLFALNPDGTVVRRNQLFNRFDFSWTADWDSVWTLLDLEFESDVQIVPIAGEPFLLNMYRNGGFLQLEGYARLQTAELMTRVVSEQIYAGGSADDAVVLSDIYGDGTDGFLYFDWSAGRVTAYRQLSPMSYQTASAGSFDIGGRRLQDGLRVPGLGVGLRGATADVVVFRDTQQSADGHETLYFFGLSDSGVALLQTLEVRPTGWGSYQGNRTWPLAAGDFLGTGHAQIAITFQFVNKALPWVVVDAPPLIYVVDRLASGGPFGVVGIDPGSGLGNANGSYAGTPMAAVTGAVVVTLAAKILDARYTDLVILAASAMNPNQTKLSVYRWNPATQVMENVYGDFIGVMLFWNPSAINAVPASGQYPGSIQTGYGKVQFTRATIGSKAREVLMIVEWSEYEQGGAYGPNGNVNVRIFGVMPGLGKITELHGSQAVLANPFAVSSASRVMVTQRGPTCVLSFQQTSNGNYLFQQLFQSQATTLPSPGEPLYVGDLLGNPDHVLITRVKGD